MKKIKDDILLASIGFLILALLSGVYYNEFSTEWSSIQSDFTKNALRKLSPAKVYAVERGLRQIWIPELNVVDRCPTCHLGIDVPGLESLKQPFATHPKLILYNRIHPFNQFGCTPCHGGQGYATKITEAHGQTKHWEIQMISGTAAKKYGFEYTSELMEMYCNQCHRSDNSTLLMRNINVAKPLIKAKGCRGCHNIQGEGGIVGPMLTFEGSKHPEAYDFANVQGEKTVFNWIFQHFKDPQKITKNTAMTNFKFTDLEARALSLLVLSWKKQNIPVRYLPDPNRKIADDVLSEKPRKKPDPALRLLNKIDLKNKGIGPISQVTLKGLDRVQAERGAKLFETKCFQCHTIEARKVGPLLLGVTKRRSPEWILNMMLNPKVMVETDPLATEMVTIYYTKMTFQDITPDQGRDILEFFRLNDLAVKNDSQEK